MLRLSKADEQKIRDYMRLLEYASSRLKFSLNEWEWGPEIEVLDRKIINSIIELGSDFNPRGYVKKGVYLQDFPVNVFAQLAVKLFSLGSSLVKLTNNSDLSFWAELAILGFIQQLRWQCLCEDDFVKFSQIVKQMYPDCDLRAFVTSLREPYANKNILSVVLQSILRTEEDVCSRSDQIVEAIKKDLLEANASEWSPKDLAMLLQFDYGAFLNVLRETDIATIRSFVCRMDVLYLSKDWTDESVRVKLVRLHADLHLLAKESNKTIIADEYHFKTQARLCRKIFKSGQDIPMEELQVPVAVSAFMTWLGHNDVDTFNMLVVRFPSIARDILHKNYIGKVCVDVDKAAEIGFQIARLCLDPDDPLLAKCEQSALREISPFLYLIGRFECFIKTRGYKQKDYGKGSILWRDFNGLLKSIIIGSATSYAKGLKCFNASCSKLLTNNRRALYLRTNPLLFYLDNQLKELVDCCNLVVGWVKQERFRMVLEKEKGCLEWPGVQKKILEIDSVFSARCVSISQKGMTSTLQP
ncbi:MAG: hypothetical protein KAS93_06835 [Gammaproteobacteria bacterium]|nr:hypothetical protein [Gammaproteobacteria bacterium]